MQSHEIPPELSPREREIAKYLGFSSIVDRRYLGRPYTVERGVFVARLTEDKYRWLGLFAQGVDGDHARDIVTDEMFRWRQHGNAIEYGNIPFCVERDVERNMFIVRDGDVYGYRMEDVEDIWMPF